MGDSSALEQAVAEVDAQIRGAEERILALQVGTLPLNPRPGAGALASCRARDPCTALAVLPPRLLSLLPRPDSSLPALVPLRASAARGGGRQPKGQSAAQRRWGLLFMSVASFLSGRLGRAPPPAVPGAAALQVQLLRNDEAIDRLLATVAAEDRTAAASHSAGMP